MSKHSEQAFREALDRGDVVTAILRAPWGYTSRLKGDGYHFSWDDGREGRGASLLDAVRAASAAPSSQEGSRG